MARIRVLVVDDSATMRGLITAALTRDPEIEVVGAAGAIRSRPAGMIKALNPDVVTLDIEMPNMNGIEFLEKIMRLRPMPVVMVSSPDPGRGRDDPARAGAGRGRLRGQARQRAPAPPRRSRKWPRRSRPPPAPRCATKADAASGRRAPPELPALGRHRGDRLVDRRGRGPADHPEPVPRDLSADGDHPAHAGDLHRQLRRPPRPGQRGQGAEASRRRAAGAGPGLCRPGRRDPPGSRAARPGCAAAWSRATRSAATGPRSTCSSTRWPRPSATRRSAPS